MWPTLLLASSSVMVEDVTSMWRDGQVSYLSSKNRIKASIRVPRKLHHTYRDSSW
jgi:hypothetical protein